ncbi:MAG TPA: carboxypeptidase-like regulatory domain-containing protein [Blastocatellia bacterium]|nr:carboxypeptidase-like regulatory domain-containing protein [Blastocatellia bacterium]
MRTATLILGAAFYLLTSSSPLLAQIQIGTLRGAVTDSTPAALAGAGVALENAVTGYRSEATTDDRGEFVFDNVPFDTYVLRVRSKGFREVAQAVRANQLQRLTATTPGWFAEDNGILHVRGVDDGIPVIGRLDGLSASGFDTEMARSINVLTGNIPAEFGGKLRLTFL